MHFEITKKLHTVLYQISPLLSGREKIIREMGEVIWLESVEKILLAMPESKRQSVVDLLNSNMPLQALALVGEEKIDVDAIIHEVALNVLDDVLQEA